MMEDTAMKEEQLEEYIPAGVYGKELITYKVCLKALAEAQAEISFKAGYRQGVENHHRTCKMDYKAGIREVVEWVNNNIAFANIGLSYKDWQAKLKEWGV